MIYVGWRSQTTPLLSMSIPSERVLPFCLETRFDILDLKSYMIILGLLTLFCFVFLIMHLFHTPTQIGYPGSLIDIDPNCHIK